MGPSIFPSIYSIIFPLYFHTNPDFPMDSPGREIQWHPWVVPRGRPGLPGVAGRASDNPLHPGRRRAAGREWRVAPGGL